MLILSRKTRQSIIISGGITVTVVGIHGGQVRLGIDAPKEVIVHREEIHNLILKEQKEKANVLIS